jgi:membrane associated rhomboid family serine protease
VIPVSDEPKTRVFPFVNVSIIVACVAVFIYELTLSTVPEGRSELDNFFRDYGVVPKELTDWLNNQSGLDEPMTVITSAFIHGGFLHLGGNMLYLWVFGDNIEDALGHVLYVLFYVACAVGAVALQVAIDTNEVIPMVGASGAISGVMGGYFILHPTARVDALFVFFIFPIPAVILIGFWFALQLFTGIATIGAAEGASEGVAVWAHVGGFATGLAIVLAMRPFIHIRPMRRRAAGW